MKRILSHAFNALHDSEGIGESVISRRLSDPANLPSHSGFLEAAATC
jgi:hypothetical protein